ncbi:30S ribosomal protein S4 [Candidatus Roizmanbacteria bacterium]|jgi:small subunit ribosomal protein S4|nr:30S ribosomal protein S4 [Candidatus Roizmanbacteria bacterium]
MRYTGSRNRIARRQGADLGLKTVGTKSHARLLRKLNVPPGQHGNRLRKKISEHGFQLKEKQKLRFIFGVTENQLKRYFLMGIKKTGNTAFFLSLFLEKRLDNVVYRLGFAPTRASSRQLVSHHHIKVNGKVVSYPSYQTKLGDVISFENDKTTKIPYVEKQLENKDLIIPNWLEKKAAVGKIIGEPTTEDIDKQVNLRSVIEFYSR